MAGKQELSLSLSLSTVADDVVSVIFEWQVMSGKGCESCKEWQEHYYWEHMDVKKIRFCKLMTRDLAQGIVSI